MDSDISFVFGDFLPSSAWKCIIATIAGSLLAVLGIFLEKARKPKQARRPSVSRAELQELIPKRPAGKTPPPVLADAALAAAGAAGSPEAGSAAAPWRTPKNSKAGSSAASDAGFVASSKDAKDKLQRSSTPAWAPGKALTKDQKIEREIKSILNKLTRENFERLCPQLLACGITAQTHVECLAREVFLKATTQHQFIEMYADLCKEVHSAVQEASADVNFKRVLLDRCQESFALYMQRPDVDESLGYEERYEELVKYKTKMLGNVRLVGHLLSRRMLSPKIIFLCADQLLECGTEEALETLCAFLDTIGPAFDTAEWPGHGKLNDVFSLCRILAGDDKLGPRIRCLLNDVLDKRDNAWKEKEIPKTTTEEQDQDWGASGHPRHRARSAADNDNCWRKQATDKPSDAHSPDNAPDRRRGPPPNRASDKASDTQSPDNGLDRRRGQPPNRISQRRTNGNSAAGGSHRNMSEM